MTIYGSTAAGTFLAMSLASGIGLAGCSATSDTGNATPSADALSDCDLVNSEIAAANEAGERERASTISRNEQINEDEELYERNPKKYWRMKRKEAIAAGMDPDEAKRSYNLNRSKPWFFTSDPERSAVNASNEYFTSAASRLWPKVQDPDLKLALRELSQGISQQANYLAISSIC